MIRSLRRLQDTATRVAQDRLPELVKQLSESDPQDVDTSVESVGVHSRDEIGQVAAAFDDVHREAVRLAAEQALLRGNVNAMFTNLSRRSQGLIQRQLSLISELESREADPDQLSSLFKLDHLATRMRRNGENLLVLAGEEPGRRWTRPVPLVDVLRAAASEVEQYERIELASVPGDRGRRPRRQRPRAPPRRAARERDLVLLAADQGPRHRSRAARRPCAGRDPRHRHRPLPRGPRRDQRAAGLAAHRGRLGLPPHGSVRGRPAVPATRHPHPAAPLRLRWHDRAGHAPRRCRHTAARSPGRACPVRAARAPFPRRRAVRRASAAVRGGAGGGRPGSAAVPAGGCSRGRPARCRCAARPGRCGLGLRVPRCRPVTVAPGQGQRPQPGPSGPAVSPGPSAPVRGRGAQNAPGPQRGGQNGFQQGAPGAGDRGRQLPASGGPRAELPAQPPPRGAAAPAAPAGRQLGQRAAGRPAAPAADSPRGHEDSDSARGHGLDVGVRAARLQRGPAAAVAPVPDRAVRTARRVRRAGPLVHGSVRPPGRERLERRFAGPGVHRAVRASRPQRPAAARAGQASGPRGAPGQLPGPRAPRKRCPRSRSPRRCRRPVPATAVRRCTTRWRRTGSTVRRAVSPRSSSRGRRQLSRSSRRSVPLRRCRSAPPRRPGDPGQRAQREWCRLAHLAQ